MVKNKFSTVFEDIEGKQVKEKKTQKRQTPRNGSRQIVCLCVWPL